MSLTHLVIDDELAFGGFAGKKEFCKIVDVWASICTKKSTGSSPELFDYVKSKQTVSTNLNRGFFPTLDVSGCWLEDNALACLVEALAMRPAVAKLDISSSDLTAQSVDVLLRLLRGQAKLVRSVDQDARLQLALLGEVVFDYTESLDHEVVQEIAMLSSALNLVNAQVYIRSAFQKKRLQDPVSAEEVTDLWTAVLGDALEHEVGAAYLAAGLQDQAGASLSYADVEAVLLCGLVDRGVVAVPNEWQMNAINFSPEWLQTYHDRAVTHALSTASRDSPRPASSPRSPYSPGARGVPVVQLDIPETELSEPESEGEELGDAAHPYDEELDTGAPAVPHLGYSRHDTPPGPMVTASLFASKYFRKAQREEVTPAQAAAALQSPSGSAKPAVHRTRAPASEVPPVMSPTKPASRAGVIAGSSNGPRGQHIRLDRIRELQALTGAGSPAPAITPRSAAQHTYFSPSPSTDIGPGRDILQGGPRSPQRDDYPHEPAVASSGDKGAEGGDATSLNNFALDLNFTTGSPRKLNVLTVCNVSRGDYELGDQIGWPRDRQHPISVLVLRDNGIAHPEHLSLHLRFECLTDLDLSFNSITGAVKGLPATLQRLDLSHNKISNVSHLINCVNLVELNLSHNNIKSFHVLPPRLEVVNLSHNVICAAITLRSLALSPKITHLDVTNNPILLDMKDWKVVLPSLLENLIELNGKPLICSRKVTAFKLSKRRGSVQAPVEIPPPQVQIKVSAQEQFVGDALRMRRDEGKFEVLEEARKSYTDRFRNRSTILRPKQVQELTDRLVAPTKAFQLRSSAVFSPPRLFSEQDLLHRNYPPRNRVASPRRAAALHTLIHTPPRSGGVRSTSSNRSVDTVRLYPNDSYLQRPQRPQSYYQQQEHDERYHQLQHQEHEEQHHQLQHHQLQQQELEQQHHHESDNDQHRHVQERRDLHEPVDHDQSPDFAGTEERKASEPERSANVLSPARNASAHDKKAVTDDTADHSTAPQQHLQSAKSTHLSPLIAARMANFNKSPATSRDGPPQPAATSVKAQGPDGNAVAKATAPAPVVPALQLSELDEDAQGADFAIHLGESDLPQPPLSAPAVVQEKLPAWTKPQSKVPEPLVPPVKEDPSPPGASAHAGHGSALGTYLGRMFVSEDAADVAGEARSFARPAPLPAPSSNVPSSNAVPGSIDPVDPDSAEVASEARSVARQAPSPTPTSTAAPTSLDAVVPGDKSFHSLSSANEAPLSALPSAPYRANAFTPTSVSPLTVVPDSYLGTPAPDEVSAQMSEVSAVTKLSVKERLMARMAKNKL